MDQPNPPPANPAIDVTSVGHPRGLSTLFFTEMWERFSYYGMRALLVLFMVDNIRGGLGLKDEIATAIYGLYTAAVYLVALPGGWVADRLLGAQRSVWIGGIIIALGHFTLAIPRTETFYLGLVIVVAGTGLLKPNISAIVGELYAPGDPRRDAGFTIYYMGINLGAAIGPLICSTLGEKLNWHYGFGAAGVGMVLGLVQFQLTRKHLGSAGLEPGHRAPLNALEKFGTTGLLIAGVTILGLALSGVVKIDPLSVARKTTSIIVTVAVVYFLYVLLFVNLTSNEKRRVGVIIVLFISSALFWSGFEQAGSSLNLFAERYTLREFAALNWQIPTGWFQSLNPVFIIVFAPVVASIWIHLARRNSDLSLPVKFGIGLILMALGFLVIAWASQSVVAGKKVLPTWLIATYLLHTLGEICLSPVGLSAVTKLAPRGLTGQMMGVWFLAASLGNLIAGLLAGEFSAENVNEMPSRFLHIVATPVIAGILLIALKRPIQSLATDRTTK
jgi:proton-dependent oligopeptide transporter, POT family